MLEMVSYAVHGTAGLGSVEVYDLKEKFEKVQENYANYVKTHFEVKGNFELTLNHRVCANGEVFEVYCNGQLMSDWSLLADRNCWTLLSQNFKVEL